MLKLSEVRNLSKQELKDKMVSLKKSLYDIRSQGATGRIEKPSRIKETRRDIARILTVLQEKEK
ncbi:MAG: 50S ribosomal protein L29 [Candidatus Omnitrophica bacterium]|nr:50S ribosomal protein L29 [Candidatus Omnitrophota bacterium]